MTTPSRNDDAPLHPDDGLLRRFADGELGDPELRDRLEQHLEECSACRERFLDLSDHESSRILIESDVDLGAPATMADPVPSLRERPPDADRDPATRTDDHADRGVGSGPMPERVGRYRLLREIGRGGMGTVFLARDSAMRRIVALKVFHPRFASARAMQRFQAEQRAAGVLQHPNIATVYETGSTDDGLLYIAMEYVDGVGITRFAPSRDLGVKDRVSLFLQACAGIEFAHQRGVVHRDVKPSNILVSASGTTPRVVIIDFGVARVLGGDALDETQDSQPGMVIGTVAYMSPEQVRGEPVTARSDLYSLGVVLYELLTGAHPTAGSDGMQALSMQEAMRRITEEAPESPSSTTTRLSRSRRTSSAPVTPGGPPRIPRTLVRDLDLVVLKALEKDPHRRYDSVAAFAQDLHLCLAGEQTWVVRPSTFRRLRRALVRWWRRLALTLAVLLVAIAAVWSIMSARSAAQRDALQERLLTLDASALRNQSLDGLSIKDLAALAVVRDDVGNVEEAGLLFAAAAGRYDVSTAPPVTLLGAARRLAGHDPSAAGVERVLAGARAWWDRVDDVGTLDEIDRLAARTFARLLIARAGPPRQAQCSDRCGPPPSGAARNGTRCGTSRSSWSGRTAAGA